MKKKLAQFLVAFVALLMVAGTGVTAYAAKGEQGVDWSKFQGSQGKFGYSSDKFSISQIGGYYDGYFVEQATYPTQVQYTIAQGKRAHTYIYSQFSTRAQADQMLNYYLPQVQTPKGSIVALDVESGNPNTDAVKYALDKVQAAGYTAVLYGYKNFLVNHLDLQSISNQYPLWLGEYPDYNVTPKPNYNYFPSFNNVAMFQFTSTYIAGGLDGNIDLTGITDNGYNGTTTSSQGGTQVKPDTSTPAIKAGQEANNTPKSDIVAGDTVKVNYSASKYATGQSIPSFVKGHSYNVAQVSGSKVLLSGIMSWVNKSDVEILNSTLSNSTATTSSNSGTTRDGNYTIHNEQGTFTANQKLAVWAYPGIWKQSASYYAGESVHYFGYVRNGNYIYAAYHRANGYIGYVAVRNANTHQALGTFQ